MTLFNRRGLPIEAANPEQEAGGTGGELPNRTRKPWRQNFSFRGTTWGRALVQLFDASTGEYYYPGTVEADQFFQDLIKETFMSGLRAESDQRSLMLEMVTRSREHDELVAALKAILEMSRR